MTSEEDRILRRSSTGLGVIVPRPEASKLRVQVVESSSEPERLETGVHQWP